MPPKVGATALTKATISSTSLVSRHSGKASTPANSLNSIALPSITGIAAAGPDVAEAEHGGAVGDDGHRVALDGQRPGLGRVLVDRHRDPRDAGRVGHREVVARLERQLGGRPRSCRPCASGRCGPRRCQPAPPPGRARRARPPRHDRSPRTRPSRRERPHGTPRARGRWRPAWPPRRRWPARHGRTRRRVVACAGAW